jgi:hypothetical protein
MAVPGPLWALQAATLPGLEGEAPAFAAGPRVALYHERPRFGRGVLQRLDVLPLTLVASGNADRAVAFRRSLEDSVRLALVQEAMAQTSGAALLKGQPLVALAPHGALSSALPGLDAEARKRWDRLLRPYSARHNLLPVSGQPLALWSVDPTTGTMLAVLPDGSAGGWSERPEVTDSRARIAASWAQAEGLAAGGPGWAGAAMLRKAKELLGFAEAMQVVVLDVTDLDEQVERAGAAAACSLAKRDVVPLSLTPTPHPFEAAVLAGTGADALPCP